MQQSYPSSEQDQSQSPALSTRLKILLWGMSLLILLSLGLNGLLLWQAYQVQQRVTTTMQQLIPGLTESLATADADLADFQDSTIELDIRINQELPINTSIPFQEMLDIPVQMTIPVRENVETTVMMEPFGAGIEVPVDIVVPLEMDFPIDETVVITIERDIPISTTVPLSFTVPLAINISDTTLPPYIERLRAGLAQFSQSIEQLLTAPETQ